MVTKSKRKQPVRKVAKATAPSASYLIKDIDGEVYERFKQRAASNGQELKFLFHRFIREFADGAHTPV